MSLSSLASPTQQWNIEDDHVDDGNYWWFPRPAIAIKKEEEEEEEEGIVVAVVYVWRPHSGCNESSVLGGHCLDHPADRISVAD